LPGEADESLASLFVFVAGLQIVNHLWLVDQRLQSI
jgi:hypothetical protein